ncbi:uncharacterized protein LOC113874810 [Abrus precatorius]|uniref:Uncharacterized protein LOC113874810 n=1 Tax=Abrus precatorius TaxID=3816 RepID=A0A8B8MMJ0_ABRPR|nr:uncharacterized protein LOC113874810 [Abrus precatorius]
MSQEGGSSRESTPASQIERLAQRFENMFERQNEAIRNVQEALANNVRRRSRDRFPHVHGDSSNSSRERRRNRRDDEERSEEKKVNVASLEFYDYALVWWDQIQRDRKRYDEEPVDTWTEMKNLMRRRFVPTYYNRELHTKLQGLRQGDKSVDDYYKEMEVAMIRANVFEEREATMARFLNGLNHDIRDIVELHPYVELEDLVHQAIKVEAQLKRNGTLRKNVSSYNSKGWKEEVKKEEISIKDIIVQSGKPSSKTSFNSTNTSASPTSQHRAIKCFKCLEKGHIASQCPNKKTMILRENGEISSDSSSQLSHASSEEDSEFEALCHEGDLLIVRRLLGSLAKEDDTTQRENIFHSRCLVLGKVCSLIVDGGSCTNVASIRLIEKLNLTTTPHPKSYKLQWLSDEGELVVNRQVLITFSIGKYKDEVLCDVVPMKASHILLGRPWQFDKKAIHDGHSNKFTFIHRGSTITLVPMTPSQVCDDQIVMRLKRKQERKDEKKKSEFEGNLKKKGEKVKTLTSEEYESEEKGETFTSEKYDSKKKGF